MHERILISKTLRTADIFGISRFAAFRMRKRYLEDQINDYLDHPHPISNLWAAEANEELIELTQKVYWSPVRTNGKDTVDDARIHEAKQYPVDQLVVFNSHGKTMAWCHDDHRPSMTFWKKGNIAKCWVCDKSFNPIDILMDRDGMAFIEAVKTLT
jgi:hypothetical protein